MLNATTTSTKHLPRPEKSPRLSGNKPQGTQIKACYALFFSKNTLYCTVQTGKTTLPGFKKKLSLPLLMSQSMEYWHLKNYNTLTLHLCWLPVHLPGPAINDIVLLTKLKHEKTAYILCCHDHWFPHDTMSGERLQKFHTGDLSSPTYE